MYTREEALESAEENLVLEEYSLELAKRSVKLSVQMYDAVKGMIEDCDKDIEYWQNALDEDQTLLEKYKNDLKQIKIDKKTVKYKLKRDKDDAELTEAHIAVQKSVLKWEKSIKEAIGPLKGTIRSDKKCLKMAKKDKENLVKWNETDVKGDIICDNDTIARHERYIEEYKARIERLNKEIEQDKQNRSK